MAPMSDRARRNSDRGPQRQIYVVGGKHLPEMKDGKIAIVNDRASTKSTIRRQTHGVLWLPRFSMGANHTAIAVLDVKIYIAGGFTRERHMNSVTGVYVYDPATDRWQTLAPLSSPRELAGHGGHRGKDSHIRRPRLRTPTER